MIPIRFVIFPPLALQVLSFYWDAGIDPIAGTEARFVDGFFEWMGSREGQQCIEVRDVLWDLLEDVQLDAKQRQLIWPDAERLDLEQSIQRIQKLYPDFPRDEVEEFVLDWIDMGYDPENYSQAQLDELDSLTERWVADHHSKAKASKKRKRTRHS